MGGIDRRLVMRAPRATMSSVPIGVVALEAGTRSSKDRLTTGRHALTATLLPPPIQRGLH